MPESKEELFGFLSEFQEKSELMSKILGTRFSMLDSFTDAEYTLLHQYSVLLQSMEQIYNDLDRTWTTERQKEP